MKSTLQASAGNLQQQLGHTTANLRSSYENSVGELAAVYEAQARQLTNAYSLAAPVSWRQHPLSPLTSLFLSHVTTNARRNGSNGCHARTVLLDLGCGAGEKANQLRDFQVDVVGIDNLLEPLRRAGGLGASAKAKVGVFNIVQADITRLPFPADSFDGAHDYLAFLHVVRGDWDAYVRAVQTVLRPGAPLLIVTFSASDLDFYGVPIQGSANRGLVFAGAIAGEPSRAAHLVNSYFYFATETELTQLFREHFDVVEMAEIAHPLSSTSPDHRFRRLWHVLLRKR